MEGMNLQAMQTCCAGLDMLAVPAGVAVPAAVKQLSKRAAQLGGALLLSMAQAMEHMTGYIITLLSCTAGFQA